MAIHFAFKHSQGPPGCGKTTSILCLARQMLGDSFKEAVLELNASNERGIDVVRERIKQFAQQRVTLPPNRHKIIILDEADSMTDGAQQAMRRTMEVHSKTTRFALACNQSDKIIGGDLNVLLLESNVIAEPIQSRCAILRYSKLSDAQVLARLLTVAQREHVDYDNTGLEALVFVAQGDMRQALNSMQSTVAGFRLVTADNVFKVCDEPHPLLVKDMLDHCVAGRVRDARKVIRHLYKLGYAPSDIIGIVMRVTKTHKMDEFFTLEFIKVSIICPLSHVVNCRRSA